MINFSKKLIWIAALLVMLGCGRAMTSQAQPACSNCNSQSNSGSNSETSNPGSSQGTNLDTFNFPSGVVSGGQYQGFKAIELDRKNKTLIFKMPISAGLLSLGVKKDIPIPQIPGGLLQVNIPPIGVGSATVIIPLTYLLKDFSIGSPLQLPNGDPLPSIPSGESPSLGFDFSINEELHPYFFFGTEVAALFIETPFDPFFDLSTQIQSEDKNYTYGSVSTVSAKRGMKGGVFMAFALPPDIAREMRKILE